MQELDENPAALSSQTPALISRNGSKNSDEKNIDETHYRKPRHSPRKPSVAKSVSTFVRRKSAKKTNSSARRPNTTDPNVDRYFPLFERKYNTFLRCYLYIFNQSNHRQSFSAHFARKRVATNTRHYELSPGLSTDLCIVHACVQDFQTCSIFALKLMVQVCHIFGASLPNFVFPVLRIDCILFYRKLNANSYFSDKVGLVSAVGSLPINPDAFYHHGLDEFFSDSAERTAHQAPASPDVGNVQAPEIMLCSQGIGKKYIYGQKLAEKDAC